MKTKRIFALILAVLMIASLFVACDDAKKSSKKDKDNTPSIVGSWEVTEDGVKMVYDFKAGGKGEATVEEYGITLDFEWETEGNKLKLTVDGDTEEGEYKISGDTLTLINDDEELVLTRVK